MRPSQHGWFWGWLLVVVSGLGRPALAQKSGHAGAGDVFLKAVPSSPQAYVGQALTVSYLLYHRVPIIDPDDEITLRFANCLVEEYPPSQPERTETINGRVYKVLLLKKYLLVPQLAGSLQLPALTRRYSVSAPPGPDDFFEEQQLVSRSIRLPAGQLPVVALPAPGDSLAFCHAVGQFQFRPVYTVSPKADNMLTVTLQVSGPGNLKGFKLVPPPLPANVDLFNERNEAQHTLTAKGWQATGTYSYEVLAAYRGTYTLPGMAFAYFDPAQGRYVSVVGPAFRWQVAKGALAPPPAANPKRTPVRRGAMLYTKATLSQDQDKYLFLGSRGCYWLLLASGGLFMVGLGYSYQQKRQAANSQHLRFRKAKSLAIQAIRKAERLPAAEADEFYKALTAVLATYLGSKLGWQESAFHFHRLPAVLLACHVPAPLQARAVGCVGQLHKLRFAASGVVAHSRSIYSEELLSVINQLDTCLYEQPPS